MDYNPQNKINIELKKKISPQNTCSTMSLRGWCFYLLFVWIVFVFFSFSRGYYVILDGITLCIFYKFWHATCNSHHFPIKASIPHLENDQCLC